MKKITAVLVILFLLLPIFALDTASLEEQLALDKKTTSISESLKVTMSSEDYLVTAGDVYTLGFFAGDSALSYKMVVDPTYKIRVANLGIVDAKGMSFLELKKRVEEIVSANYPMSGVQFVITSPGAFKVTIKGEVDSTSYKTISGLVRLSDIVKDYGTQYASKRFFEIVSSDGKVKDYDLFQAQRFGDLTNDPYLRPDDTIVYKRYERIATIDGSVERPGTYELLKNDNLKALVEYYGGGLDPLADTQKIVLSRPVNEKQEYLSKNDIDKNYSIENLDVITINSKMDLKNTIFIQGAVSVPLEEKLSIKENSSTRNLTYEFTEGETYCDFIRANRTYFNETSDYDRAYIRRGDQTVSIDLYSMVYNPEYKSDVKLVSGDVLVVPFKQFYVTVTGAVRLPGRYAYVPDRTWDYYVGLAGGIDDELNDGDKVKITDINGNNVKDNSFIQPESTIKALKNSKLYNFSKYAVPVSTTLTIITSALLSLTYIQTLSK